MNWYKALDYFFLYFHLVFTLFNIFGWIPKRTRTLHFYTILITTISWFGLGIFYGIGYCPLTDWHWQVREHLGHPDMPNSYITFLITYFTGLKPNEELVDQAVFICFILCLAIAFYLKFKRKPSHSIQTR